MKQFTKAKTARTYINADAQGNLLTETKKIQERWTEYILFQINLLTYKTLREKQSTYLHSMLAASIPSRSNNDNILSVPKVKTITGARAFHSCAPSLWNNVPLSVRSAT